MEPPGSRNASDKGRGRRPFQHPDSLLASERNSRRVALYTGEVYSLVKVLPAQAGSEFYGLGSALALAFLVAGLIASVFHLGRPERAWRAAARWRTSWLSPHLLAVA